jgi:hypothetical protein
MNRAEYLQAMRDVRKTQARVEEEQAKLIKAAYIELLKPFVDGIRRGERTPINKTELYLRFIDIIKTNARKPADEADAVHKEFKRSLFEKLGLKPPTDDTSQHKSVPISIENDKQKIPNAREPFKPKEYKGAGFASMGITGYRKDASGKIIWDTLAVEFMFRKRYDLSKRVWAAINENEQTIFEIVRTGQARGRDIKDIAKDLEIYIKDSQNGAERVMGRWGKLKPAGLPADADLRTKPYLAIREQVSLSQMAYRKRLGKGGIDYRTLRIMRTETAAQLGDRQAEIARDTDISTGEVDWILHKGRDGWNCGCAKMAAGSPYNINDSDFVPPPLHPNCDCVLRPRLKSDEEILREVQAEHHGDSGQGQPPSLPPEPTPLAPPPSGEYPKILSKEYKEMQRPLANLDPKDADTIAKYTYQHNVPINNIMRKEGMGKAVNKNSPAYKDAQRIKAVLSQHTLPACTLWRGLRGSGEVALFGKKFEDDYVQAFEDYYDGNKKPLEMIRLRMLSAGVIKYYSFVSTSIKNLEWSNIILKINVPAGTQGAAIGNYSYYDDENEVLINCGVLLRIDSVIPTLKNEGFLIETTLVGRL